MSGNSFGDIFKITTFGESHGKAIGVVIDGCPAGLDIDLNQIQHDLDNRKPGTYKGASARIEDHTFEVLSGIFEGKSIGTPICLVVYNQNQNSADYDHLKEVFRPSHADYTYYTKYGIRDHRGGGRQSARETVARVLAGAIAKQVLNTYHIKVQALVSQIGSIAYNGQLEAEHFQFAKANTLRTVDESTQLKMQNEIDIALKEGDSLGGIIACRCEGVPAGIGEPVFDKLHAVLGQAMLSINAVKGFEIGSGFQSVSMRGSEHNDSFGIINNEIMTHTNLSGGIQGGISNGAPIVMKIAFKPVSSISKTQETINTNKEKIQLNISGRHDACVLPRAVVIVEAMAAITILDFILRNNNSKLQPFSHKI
jgi:chorismate synthase